jgi:hypothetical protein
MDVRGADECEGYLLSLLAHRGPQRKAGQRRGGGGFDEFPAWKGLFHISAAVKRSKARSARQGGLQKTAIISRFSVGQFEGKYSP